MPKPKVRRPVSCPISSGSFPCRDNPQKYRPESAFRRPIEEGKLLPPKESAPRPAILPHDPAVRTMLVTRLTPFTIVHVTPTHTGVAHGSCGPEPWHQPVSAGL